MEEIDFARGKEIAMKWIASVMLLSALLSTGCAMCQSCFDDAYPHYGSIAERTERNCGRVGSAFDPAGPDVGERIPVRREDTAPTGTPQRKPIIAEEMGDET